MTDDAGTPRPWAATASDPTSSGSGSSCATCSPTVARPTSSAPVRRGVADSLTDRADGSADRGRSSCALADVVTGKPVPPRASVRRRGSPAGGRAALLRRCGRTWTREPLGEWVLRSAPPYGGRLLQAGQLRAGDGRPGRPLDEASARVRACVRASWTGGRSCRSSARRGRARACADLGWRALRCRRLRTPCSLRSPRSYDALPPPPDGRRGRRVPRPACTVAAPGRRGTAWRGARSTATGWCLHSLARRPEHRRPGLATGSSPSCSTGAPRAGARTAVAARGDRQPAARRALRAARVRHPPHQPLPRPLGRAEKAAATPSGRGPTRRAGPARAPRRPASRRC